jgi:hypothetical protein
MNGRNVLKGGKMDKGAEEGTFGTHSGTDKTNRNESPGG